jgi:hypothetical protein
MKNITAQTIKKAITATARVSGAFTVAGQQAQAWGSSYEALADTTADQMAGEMLREDIAAMSAWLEVNGYDVSGVRVRGNGAWLALVWGVTEYDDAQYARIFSNVD